MSELSTSASLEPFPYPPQGKVLYVIRRRFLRDAAALATASLLASACSYSDVPSISNNPEKLLTEGGFSAPDLDMQVIDSPFEDTNRREPVIAFSGPATKVEAWVNENFSGGIDTRADRDDLPIVVARLGEGVQWKGDRVASGAHEPIAFVVVVGQEDDPTVHVAMQGPER